MRAVPILLAGMAVASCATNPPVPRADRDAAQLQQAIAGRVPGRSANCLPSYRADNMTVLDNGTLLFRDGSTTWVSRLSEGCARAGLSNYALVTKTYGGTGLCSGDIVQLVDTASGTFAGACTVAPFMAYRRP